jgi:hypothetical protein
MYVAAKKNPKINSIGKDHGTYCQDCYARNQNVICFCTQNYVWLHLKICLFWKKY